MRNKMNSYRPKNLPLTIIGIMLLFISYAIVVSANNQFTTQNVKDFSTLISILYGICGSIFSIIGSRGV